MPRYLVTGGAGFIGSNLVRTLLQDPANEVVNLDALTYAGNLDSLRDVENDPRYRLLHLDLRNGPAVREAMVETRPDGIFHLAAESHVDRSIDAPGDFIQTNIVGTFHLLQAARECWSDRLLSTETPNRAERTGAQRRWPTANRLERSDSPSGSRPAGRIKHRNTETPIFIHASTDEVYGSLAEDAPPATELTRYDPHSPYSASKAASDHLVRAWHDTYGLPVIITNCTNNYGPFQFPEKLVPMVILRALAGEPVPVYGNGENIRDWLHVEDHCRALVAVMEKGTLGSTYNIGANDEQTNIDLVQSLCRILDELQPRASGEPYENLIEFVPDRPGHDFRYATDATRMRTELAWAPQHDIESGLRSTVGWYLENRGWWQPILANRYHLERLGL